MTPISTFDIKKEPLLDILQNIKLGQIQLVDFQRSWCWDDDKIKRLIASVSLSFPIGAMMLQEQGNLPKFKPRLVEGVEAEPSSLAKSLILDGQQRLTSLFMSLLSDKPVFVNRGKRYQPLQRWYYIDIHLALDYPHVDRRDAILAFNSHKKLRRPKESPCFYDCSTSEREFEHHLFPVAEIFNFCQWRDNYAKYWHYDPHHLQLIARFEQEVIKKFEHYQIGLFVLREELPKEAICYIFEENNKQQCELTYFDLLTSDFATSDFDLRADWQLREIRFQKHRVLRLLKDTDFVQAITLLTNYQRRMAAKEQGIIPERLPRIACNRQDILQLKVDDYQQWVEPLSQGFEEAARFLHSQSIYDADDLPYPLQLVVIAPLFAILGQGAKVESVRRKLAQWFYSGAASGIYSRSREATAAKDLMEIPLWLQGGNLPTTLRESHLSAERLEALVNSQGATYRALSALLRRDGAKDFLTGEPITSVNYFEEKIENHHIFPKDWAKKQKFSRSKYNSIVNKTPLSLTTNRFIGSKAPSAYLAQLEARGIPQERLDEILRSHLIEPDYLRNDDFYGFFEARTQALLDKIEQATGKSF